MSEQNNDRIEFVSLTEKQVFTKIWTSPRLVFRYIDENRFEKWMFPLLFMSGVVTGINNAIDRGAGDEMSLTMILALPVFFGGLLGWLSYYIGSSLLSWTGKWINGKGDMKSIFRMTAYAMIPMILLLLAYVPFIFMFDVRLFQSDFGIYTGETTALMTMGFIQIILGIWVLVIYVTGLSVVQKFSIGKAILNILISMIVIIVPVVLLVLIFDNFF